APQLPLRRLGRRGRAHARQPAALAGAVHHGARGPQGKGGGPRQRRAVQLPVLLPQRAPAGAVFGRREEEFHP
nr:hypothetical protein [Tanacetum cinerariifolium]